MLKLHNSPAKSSRSTTNPPVINPASLPAIADIPTVAAAVPAQHQRRCIHRSQYLRPAALGSAQRSALVDRTYAIYSETAGGWTREEFEAEVINSASRLYPSPERPTPSDVDALVRAISTRRHYVAVGENPWVVRSAATPLDASRLVRLQDDPRARFYTEINPRFAEGQALLTLIPADVANITATLLRALLRALKTPAAQRVHRVAVRGSSAHGRCWWRWLEELATAAGRRWSTAAMAWAWPWGQA